MYLSPCLQWLARADLNQYRTTKLISCEQDIPKGFITAALKMFQEMAIDPHLAPRISRTEEILENLRRNSTNSEAKEKYEKLKSWLQSDQSDFPESVDHFAKHTGPDIAQKDTWSTLIATAIWHHSSSTTDRCKTGSMIQQWMWSPAY